MPRVLLSRIAWLPGKQPVIQGQSTFQLTAWPDGNKTFFAVRPGHIKLTPADAKIVSLWLVGRLTRQEFEKSRTDLDYGRDEREVVE